MSAPKKKPATRNKKDEPGYWKRLWTGVWLFPVILAIPFLLMSAFQISGSSIGGSYYHAFYGGGKDPNLLANHPQPIRSDEWLVTTQLTIAQHAAGFPRVNENIDSGRDMSIVGDAPYKDWSAVFKPQNLAFLVLPLGVAFAFKWWLLLYLTIVSCYFLVLRFFPTRRLFAALLGASVGCSPFLFWWYATGTFGPIFYGFFIILVSMRLINGEPLPFKRLARYSTPAYILTLAYLLTCFAIILYPPFQIPVALAVAFFLTGYYIDRFGLRGLTSRESLRRLGAFLAAFVLAGAIVLAFIYTRQGVIDAIRNSAYPGVRPLEVSGYPVHELFSTYLQPQLQRVNRAANYYANQSEASQFLLFLPFLLIPGFIALIAHYRIRHKLNWTLLAVQSCAVIFFCNLLIPGKLLVPFYKVLLLTQVQHGRLFIGFGFLGVLQLLLLLKTVQDLKPDRRTLTILAGAWTLLCLSVLAWVGWYTREHWPKFVSNEYFIGGLGVFFAIIIFSFLSQRLLLGASLLFALSIGSVYNVHPFYRGLGPYHDGQLTQAIQRVSKPGDSWANLDNLIYENAPLLANRDSVSGIKPYPDIHFWRQVQGAGSHNHNDYVYNRYAHVLFTTNTNWPDWPSQLHLLSPDTFGVQFGCTSFVKRHVDYALSIHTIDYPCTAKVAEVRYPQVTFYIYRVD